MGLEVRGIRKNYGEFSLALDFSVAPGETLALVGPSGCGKTTALNLIAGLARPDEGEITIDGKVVSNLPVWKRNISVVFQDLALFPHLNVGKNIGYGPFIRRFPREERRRILEETLRIIRLSGYEGRRIDTLSGGERQRVAIARALAVNPRALLLDEPFSGLDAPLRRELRREFREIRGGSRAPWVFVTHDREEAAVMGDRIILLSRGRIVEEGTGGELFLAPQTEFGANFFGAGGTLPCEFRGAEAGGTRVSSPLGELLVPPPSSYTPGSLLFVPHEALYPADRESRDFAGAGGGKAPGPAVTLLFRGSVFEGERIVADLVLPGGGVFPVKTALRTRLPRAGDPMVWHIDQGLLRFVRPGP
jgi:ABC-type Fe3+/spermidine/putrescine transport system ATPase subunit